MIGRRLLCSALVLGFGAGGIGCFDSTAPGGSAALSIYPVFEGFGVMDGTPNDVDSFHITIVNPPNPDIVRGVRIAPGQDTIEIRLEFDLTGPATVQVNFEGWSTATGLRLYSGTQTANVTPGGVSTPQPVAAAYVGPGASVDSVIVSPTAAALQPGGTTQLSYNGYDNNAVLPDDSVPVWYGSSDSGVARVSRSGVVTAIADGTARVFVTTLANRNIRDTSVITVSSAPAPAISLSTGSVTFLDTAGTANPAAQTVNVTNSGGGTLSGLSTGTIAYGAGGSGWLSASLTGSTAPATLTLQPSNAGLGAGTYTATVPVTSPAASNSPQTVSVTYTVAAQPVPASLTITQGYANLAPAATLGLTVTARDNQNNPIPTTGTTFTSRATSVATVNGTSGAVTAVARGTAVIVAQLGGLSDSMAVTVSDTSVVFSAIADSRAFDKVSVGDTVRVRIAVDLSRVAPEKLGSYNDSLAWNPAVLRYVRTDVVAGGFTAPTVNATQATAGQLRFGAADATGHAGPTVGLATIIFVAQGSGSTSLIQQVTDISAAATFKNLLPGALFFASSVRVQ